MPCLSGKGKISYGFLSSRSNLSCFYQPWTAGFAVRLRLAYYAGNVWSSVILRRLCFNGYFSNDNSFGSAQPKAYKKDSYYLDSNRLYFADRDWTARFFILLSVLYAFFICRSLWAGRWVCGFIPKSLCCKPLFFLGNEFSALLLWSWSRHQPKYHGCCAEICTLE